MGNAHPNIVPYQDFPTADGHMILAIGNDGQFAKFCATVGHPEWAADPRYATSAARVINRHTLISAMREVTATRTTAEWVKSFEAVGVPCGPINTIAQVFEDPHVKERGTAISVPHPVGGQIPLVANPIRLSETPIEYRMAPPLLGQHTGEVLREVLGLDEQRMSDLRNRKVI
jgi:crotonobetainyl-CoA:carnitine CoA-transferase CaiB-like acyl-CoA transferase